MDPLVKLGNLPVVAYFDLQKPGFYTQLRPKVTLIPVPFGESYDRPPLTWAPAAPIW